jgi:hypothetical protein
MIFPWWFPSEEILKIQFRILTFSSVFYDINQSNYMQGGYFQKIWSILVQFVKWQSGLIAEVCLSHSVAFNYSHLRTDQLLFGVNCSIEIRLLWEIGGIWVKWCRERSEIKFDNDILGASISHQFAIFVFMSVIFVRMTVNSKSAPMSNSYNTTPTI